MAAQLRLARRRSGPLHWLLGPTILLAFLAGCVGDQKSGTAKPTTPQAKEKPAAVKPAAPAAAPNKPAPSAKPDKPTPAAAPNKPAPAPAPTAAEKPKTEKPKDEAPVDKKPSVAQPSADQPLDWQWQEGKPMTDEDRDALAKMILAAAEEGQKRQASEQPQKPDVRTAPAQPTTRPGEAPKKEGCGATGGPAIDLNPLPPDQPQPKFACKQKKVVTEGVWQGKTAEFSFTIGNEGEAPLAVRIKPG
jgi:hypothetical protein